MKPSDSRYLDIRGLRYHVRSWGPAAGRPVVFLHGWMDASASFQFVVDALARDWRILAPDWRGEGLTAWVASGTYNYPDYIADLDGLLEALHPGEPADIVGHSRGGNIASLYAGIRPERVRRVVNIEGFGLRARGADEAPAHYAHWLDQLRASPQARSYAGFAELAGQIRRHNPRLSAAQADFLSRHWGAERPDGQVTLRADPRLSRPTSLFFRLDEMLACWRQVAAPVLWIEATESTNRQRHHISGDDYAARRAALSAARVELVPDAGHMVHLEQPEKLARLIEAFLDE
jgi:pimeloyl-ACP methyl ester carboxylesterase